MYRRGEEITEIYGTDIFQLRMKFLVNKRASQLCTLLKGFRKETLKKARLACSTFKHVRAIPLQRSTHVILAVRECLQFVLFICLCSFH